MANQIHFSRGDTVPIIVTVKDGSSLPVDISNFNFYFTAKADETLGDGSAIIAKTITSHSDPTNGETTITLATSDTSGLTAPNVLTYDIQMRDTGSQITTVVKGDLIVKRDITITG